MTSTPHYDEANLLQSTVSMAPLHRSSISFSISSCASESTAVIVQQISQSSASSSSLSLSLYLSWRGRNSFGLTRGRPWRRIGGCDISKQTNINKGNHSQSSGFVWALVLDLMLETWVEPFVYSLVFSDCYVSMLLKYWSVLVLHANKINIFTHEFPP